MVMRRESAQRSPQVRFTEDHQAVEAFFFDGPAKSFRVRIAVRGAVRRLNDANPCGRQRVLTRHTPFRIAVTDQHAVTGEHAIVGMGQRACDLDDERLVGVRCRPYQLHAARGEVNHKQRVDTMQRVRVTAQYSTSDKGGALP